MTMNTLEHANANKTNHHLSSIVVRSTVIQSSSGNKRTMLIGGTAVERSMVSMGSIAIYSVRPVTSSKLSTSTLYQGNQREHKRHTFYAVHVQNALTGRSWVVHRRYSDFVLLRKLMEAHLEQVGTIFPKLKEIVKGLYFPRKHKVTSKLNRVIDHRCTAFLDYLVMLHRVMISQGYQMNKRICEMGQSILRGFLGSTRIHKSCHRDLYTIPNHIPQSKLTPDDREIVNQCGSLKTVLEEEFEDEEDEEQKICGAVRMLRCAEEEVSVYSDTDCSDTDSNSTISNPDDGDEETKPVPTSTRRNTKKILHIRGNSSTRGNLLDVLKR